MFRLRELLHGGSPILRTSRYQVFDVTTLPAGIADHLLYFAASVFWRAAAHAWTLYGQPVGCISLDTELQEHLRLCLLGDEAFPDNARMRVHVSSEDEPDQMIVGPTSLEMDNVFRHKFYIPGVLFIMFHATILPAEYEPGAVNSRGTQLIWLCPWRDDSLLHGFVNLAKQHA